MVWEIRTDVCPRIVVLHHWSQRTAIAEFGSGKQGHRVPTGIHCRKAGTRLVVERPTELGDWLHDGLFRAKHGLLRCEDTALGPEEISARQQSGENALLLEVAAVVVCVLVPYNVSQLTPASSQFVDVDHRCVWSPGRNQRYVTLSGCCRSEVKSSITFFLI